MTTYQEDSFLSEVLEGTAIPLGKLAYFRERFRNRLYDLVVSVFLVQEKTKGLTRADIARRIQRRPEQITRWFGAPGNWTIDTVSDLLLAMGTEPDFYVTSLGKQTKEKFTVEVEGGKKLRPNDIIMTQGGGNSRDARIPLELGQ
jgi:DNA-binding phage protein